MTDADLRQEYRLIPMPVIEDLRRRAEGKPDAQLLLLHVLMMRLPIQREPRKKAKVTL